MFFEQRLEKSRFLGSPVVARKGPGLMAWTACWSLVSVTSLLGQAGAPPAEFMCWQQVSWGFGEEEIAEGLGNDIKANPDSHGFMNLYSPYLISDFRVGDQTFTVYFQLDPDRRTLERILVQSMLQDATVLELAGNEKAFGEIELYLIQHYGQPLVREETATKRTRKWASDSTIVELGLLDLSLIDSSLLTLTCARNAGLGRSGG